MKKHTVKNGRFFIIPIISFFLLFFAIGLFIFQLFKAPKEVKAVVGTLDIKAITGSAWTPGGIWNSSGNVGIGTTNPTVKLDVAGDLNITGNTNMCSLVAYTATSGTTYCPAGYYVWSATATTTGDMLCCKVSNPI